MSESTDFYDPLADLRVLELGHVVAAPYATLMLSDLGAEVVKVEHPKHGDHMRVAGDTARSIFASLNRDKQSIALDLESEDDRQAFLTLVREADIVVENFSPGSLERLGMGYDRLRKSNKSLIYVSIKGYEGSGPYSDRTATDPIIQAASGLMSVTGYTNSPPARTGTSVVDVATAQYAVMATLLALKRRRETGNGDYVTVPMFQTGVTLMSYWLAYQQQFDENPQRMGASHSLYAPYNVYPTADGGHIFMAATSDDHWRIIKDELGLSLPFETRDERLEHRKSIDDAIAAITSEHPRSEIVDQLLTSGVPVAPVNEVSDLVDNPHLNAVDALTRVDTPEAENVAVPWTIPWQRAPTRSHDPPRLGADTRPILQSLGVDTVDRF
ncbi:CaiB/BaiF CoA transferase family protein [Haladaptatus sp. NG-SE-30]